MMRATSILFWFGLTIAASLMLYHTSDRVHELSQQLHDLNNQIQAEQQSLHVLKAEWVYLANPARVEATTHKFLTAMRPTSPHQVTTLDELTEMVPTRSEAMASVAVTTTPIASVRGSLPRLAAAAISKKLKAVHTASAAASHINEHMVMQRTASAQPLPTSISGLLNDLETHP